MATNPVGIAAPQSLHRVLADVLGRIGWSTTALVDPVRMGAPPPPHRGRWVRIGDPSDGPDVLGWEAVWAHPEVTVQREGAAAKAGWDASRWVLHATEHWAQGAAASGLSAEAEGFSKARPSVGPPAASGPPSSPAGPSSASGPGDRGLPAAEPTAAETMPLIVVVAGEGGPAALRGWLPLLPVLDAPVVVFQTLPQGRYEVLVGNLGKVCPRPVGLAEDGQGLEAGRVYFLPPGRTVVEAERGWRVAPGPAEAAAGPAGVSRGAVVVFSGAQRGWLLPCLDAAQAGALLVGQHPADAYDATTLSALIGMGLTAAPPEDLAAYLEERWGARPSLPGPAVP